MNREQIISTYGHLLSNFGGSDPQGLLVFLDQQFKTRRNHIDFPDVYALAMGLQFQLDLLSLLIGEGILPSEGSEADSSRGIIEKWHLRRSHRSGNDHGSYFDTKGRMMPRVRSGETEFIGTHKEANTEVRRLTETEADHGYTWHVISSSPITKTATQPSNEDPSQAILEEVDRRRWSQHLGNC